MLLLMVISCKASPASDLTKNALIPQPVTVTAGNEMFELAKSTKIIIAGKNNRLTALGKYLSGTLAPATGFKLPVRNEKLIQISPRIVLALDESLSNLGTEGYRLDVEKREITLTAFRPAGVFRGIQTLRQLLPPEIESDTAQKIIWYVPTGTIVDYPKYKHRGVMLDVARHFFCVKDVKRFIDLISLYKINVLHMHLADDQGWRIEIKSWPKLTGTGGSTQVGGGEGGYYTQKEFSDIVDYAASRYISIIPEIDMPGHTNAALASYPELNCDNKAPKLYTGTRVGFSSLCIDKEITYVFVDDVIREIAAISPSPYIHIGGDESFSTKKADFITFINRTRDIVTKYEKIMIGWDEVAHGDIGPDHVIQYWSNKKNALKGSSKGAGVILSPSNHAYLDMKYDAKTKLGLTWAGYIEVDKAYTWQPATLIEGLPAENILGVEALLWSETLTVMDEIEFLLFPRMPGIAEIGWSQSESLNWESYRERLAQHRGRFNYLNIDYYRSPLVPW